MIPAPLRKAIKASDKSTAATFWHGVALIRGGAIVAEGYNHDNIHAEVSALNKVWPNKRKGLTLWSIRTTASGKLANAKPCEECMPFLRANGVKKVYYSNSAGDIIFMRL